MVVELELEHVLKILIEKKAECKLRVEWMLCPSLLVECGRRCEDRMTMSSTSSYSVPGQNRASESVRCKIMHSFELLYGKSAFTSSSSSHLPLCPIAPEHPQTQQVFVHPTYH